MRWIVSPLLIVAGILLMKYTVALTNQFTGPIDFAEKYFKFLGGTYAWWRILGLFLVIFGMAWLTGVIAYNPDTEFQLPK